MLSKFFDASSTFHVSILGDRLARRTACRTLMLALLALPAAALAQVSVGGSTRTAPPDDFDNRMKRITEATGKVGQSGGGDCASCPQACETRCARPGDTKCEAELRNAREKAFAACRAKKRP